MMACGTSFTLLLENVAARVPVVMMNANESTA
jgi:hypothetical protein